MGKIIILGNKGSGKRTLKEKICSQLADFDFDVYSGDTLSSYVAAILVVSLTDGPMPETLEHLLSVHKAGIPNIFCFLNKTDLLKDNHLQDLVKLECQELGRKYGYSGENFLIITGSALQNKNIDVLTQQIKNNINKPYIQLDFKLPEYRCRRCKQLYHTPFEVCKVCNTKQKVSFFSRLFGDN